MVVVLVTIISFLMVHMIPGDPVLRMLGAHTTQAQIDNLRHELGLDLPLIVQYGRWILDIFQGDFGKSLIYREDVWHLIASRFPITLYLAFLSLVISTVVGVVAGVISAVKRGSLLDTVITFLANIGIAVPTFWLGILGIYLFGLKLDLLPVEGWTSPAEDFFMSFKQVIMPVIALSVPNIAIVARQSRSSMLESINQDYIRTAVSKGLSRNKIHYKHALRNALIPVLTLTGLELVFLIGGEVLVETVFNIPGVGRLLIRAALDKDYLIVQALVLIFGIAVCLINFLVDIAYGWVDPRIRYN